MNAYGKQIINTIIFWNNLSAVWNIILWTYTILMAREFQQSSDATIPSILNVHEVTA